MVKRRLTRIAYPRAWAPTLSARSQPGRLGHIGATPIALLSAEQARDRLNCPTGQTEMRFRRRRSSGRRDNATFGGLSPAEAPHMSCPGTEPVKPAKAVDAREMSEMPETVEPGEAV